MNSVIDHVRESVLTAPDDLELHALLPWARGDEPLPCTEAALNVIVREWWHAQTDARTLLREMIFADRRAGVFGACVCARWALERYWHDDDCRPWIAVEAAEAWCRGEATIEQVARAAEEAREATYEADTVDTTSYAAAYAAAAAVAVSVTDAMARADEAAESAASYSLCFPVGDFDDSKRKVTEVLRELCNVVRAAVECPPVEVWFASELQKVKG